MNGRTTAVKLAGIAVLTLALLVPVAFVDLVLDERQGLRDAARAEITASWGRRQTIAGPVLVVPYRQRYKERETFHVEGALREREVDRERVVRATFLPAKLDIGGTVAPKTLHRGIYEAVVYSGRLELAGTLPRPDWRSLKVDPKDVLWDDATVSFAVSDLRGTQGDLALRLGGRTVPLLPGTSIPGFESGVHARLGKALDAPEGFLLDLQLNGSEELRIAPLGIRTAVSIESSWADPKFMGAFLPAERRVDASGFRARWDIPYFGRNYPQASNGQDGGLPSREALEPALFGVSFLSQVDAYRMVERSVKYAILFIALVFSAFFLFEIVYALRIHPLQYVLVGLSLCLFFLVLLSLSEFLPFSAAYAAAAALTILTTTAYAAAFLGSGKRTALLGAEMSAVYGYLYVVLQLQDYSLLMGTALLAGVLGAVMYGTRRADWYGLDASMRPAAR